MPKKQPSNPDDCSPPPPPSSPSPPPQPRVTSQSGVEQDKCEINKRKLYCKKHTCEVRSFDVTSKKWQWVEKRKEYAWVSKKSKKYVCPSVQGGSQDSEKLAGEPRTPKPGGEFANFEGSNCNNNTGAIMNHSGASMSSLESKSEVNKEL